MTSANGEANWKYRMKRLLRAPNLAAILLLTLASSFGLAAQQRKLYIFNWPEYTPDSVIANFKNIDPAILARSKDYDPGNKYSVPYYMGAAGIAVNKTKVKSYERSWSIFARRDLKNRMTMFDIMREVLGDALAFQGKSVNTANDSEIKDAKDLINKTWKPNLLKFVDFAAAAKSFATGEAWVTQGYVENIFMEHDKSKRGDVDFFIPTEGGPLYLDSMVVPKNSKNINVPASALKKGNTWYKAEDLAKCELELDLGSALDKYNAAWEEIKVGK
jgi:spermidine/putrescine transport system substrate-binding protein